MVEFSIIFIKEEILLERRESTAGRTVTKILIKRS